MSLGFLFLWRKFKFITHKYWRQFIIYILCSYHFPLSKNICWRALARQLPIFYNSEKKAKLSDVRLKTCAVDCVFYIWAFRGACECRRFGAFRRVSGLSWVQFTFHVTLGDAVTEKKTPLREKYNKICMKVIASNRYRVLVNRREGI